MKEVSGDIWKLAHFLKDAIVIPTNIGYTKSGEAVMGRGLALQAAKRFSSLTTVYGEHCMVHKEATPICMDRFVGLRGARHLILFPTKPFNRAKPNMSWQSKADIKLIERGLRQLAMFAPPKPDGKIYVPMLGCGHGALHRGDVRQLMDSLLVEDHFIRVRSTR